MQPMSYNAWLYTMANPANHIDPTGLFSRAQIAKSFGVDSFESVLAYYDVNREHWGFLASLLRALPGDDLYPGTFALGPMVDQHQIWPGHISRIGYTENQGITFDNVPLITLLQSYSLAIPTTGRGPVAALWRNIDATYFTLGDGAGNKEEYIDGSGEIDIPDFWGISGSYSLLQGMYMRDRFGYAYFTPSLNFGSALLGMAYSEGYIGQPIQSGTDHVIRGVLPEAELHARLAEWGWCFSAQGAMVYGIGGGACLNQSYYAIYSVGAQVDISVNIEPYTFPLGKDTAQGWDWAVQDRLGGVYRHDLMSMPEFAYLECAIYLPLIAR